MNNEKNTAFGGGFTQGTSMQATKKWSKEMFSNYEDYSAHAAGSKTSQWYSSERVWNCTPPAPVTGSFKSVISRIGRMLERPARGGKYAHAYGLHD